MKKILFLFITLFLHLNSFFTLHCLDVLTFKEKKFIQDHLVSSQQKKIVDQLDADVRGIAHLVEKFEKEINLIQEYRTRLISDVVTGKIDVRNIPEDRISFEEEFEANLEEDDLLAPEAEIEEEVYADD